MFYKCLFEDLEEIAQGSEFFESLNHNDKFGIRCGHGIYKQINKSLSVKSCFSICPNVFG